MPTVPGRTESTQGRTQRENVSAPHRTAYVHELWKMLYFESTFGWGYNTYLVVWLQYICVCLASISTPAISISIYLPVSSLVSHSEDPAECDIFYSCLNGVGSSTRWVYSPPPPSPPLPPALFIAPFPVLFLKPVLFLNNCYLGRYRAVFTTV
jgi:hypothetical protein